MLQTLKEYVGDLSRSLPAVVDSMKSIFGPMYRVGGDDRVYSIGNQFAAIYVVSETSAIGLAWKKDQMIESIYWWDEFNFEDPDYELDLPQGVDVENILPQIHQSIQMKHVGAIQV
jgi:hypothetical protein